MLSGKSNLDLSFYIVYFIIPTLLIPNLYSNKKLSLKTIILTISVAPIFSVFYISKIFSRDYNNAITMGTSYNYLTPVMACITYLLYYFKNQSLKNKIIYLIFVSIPNLIFLFQIFMYGSRGPIICIFVLLFIKFIFKFDKDIRQFSINNIKFLLALILLFILVTNFWTLIGQISNYIDSNFISKMIKLHETDNVLNNRDAEYSLAMTMIPDKLLFGHGISSFEYYTGYSYPHNLFLQLMFDAGIICTVLVLVPIIFYILLGLKNISYDVFVFNSFLFSYAFVKSMFSGNIWENEKLWLLFSMCIISLTNETLTIYSYKSYSFNLESK